MNFRNLINNYSECHNFEIKIINKEIYIYYYDKIENFSSEKIIIFDKKQKYIILGKNLVIDTLYKELLIIKGQIKNINIEDINE